MEVALLLSPRNNNLIMRAVSEPAVTLKPASLPAPYECLDETPCHYTETHWVLLSIFFPVCNLIDKKGIFDHRGPQAISLLLLVAR